ncbi:MAG: hypothetical protein ACI8XB_002728 [Patiriisocius sp.]|jgi:uncharacterized protein (TIGR02722 family)
MKKLTITLSIILVGMMALESCSRKITRIDPDTEIDLSGRWNDTDSKLAAEELIEEIRTGNWVSNHMRDNEGKEPTIIIGLVRNKSHEHIEAETFIKDMEKALIRGEKVRVVQGGEMRNEIRAERADQQENSSLSTMKKFGLEHGADYMLQGNINSIVDAYKKDKVVFYQIDLELTNMQTNEKVWIGDKKIKKFIKN